MMGRRPRKGCGVMETKGRVSKTWSQGQMRRFACQSGVTFS